MFVTNWISTTKIQKISEITNFFRHYFLSRTEVFFYINVKRVIADRQCELDFLQDGSTNSISETGFVLRFQFLEMKKLTIT